MVASAIETALAVRISAPAANAAGRSCMRAALIKRSEPLQAIQADPAVNPAVADRPGSLLVINCDRVGIELIRDALIRGSLFRIETARTQMAIQITYCTE